MTSEVGLPNVYFITLSDMFCDFRPTIVGYGPVLCDSILVCVIIAEELYVTVIISAASYHLPANNGNCYTVIRIITQSIMLFGTTVSTC